MQDRNIAKGSLGDKGNWSLDLKGGNPVATLSYSSSEAVVSVSAEVKSKAGLDELKALIPGKIDDAIIDVIEAALLPETPAAPTV